MKIRDEEKLQEKIESTASQIQNREPFKFDIDKDALYNQYVNQYIQQGKMAAMDTMGQAQAMTGGYGNSYAQNVGQQTYNQHLNQINAAVPDFYQMALNRYVAEGDQLQNNLNTMLQMDELAYNREQDELKTQQANYDRLMTMIEVFGYKPTPEEMAAAGMTDAHLAAIVGDVPAPSYAAPTYDTHGFTDEEIRNLQAQAGIAVDGVWGSDTQKAFEAALAQIEEEEEEEKEEKPRRGGTSR